MMKCFHFCYNFAFKFNLRRYMTVVTSMETLLAELEESASAGKKVDICLVCPGPRGPHPLMVLPSPFEDS
jgi:hypothetical protein